MFHCGHPQLRQGFTIGPRMRRRDEGDDEIGRMFARAPPVGSDSGQGRIGTIFQFGSSGFHPLARGSRNFGMVAQGKRDSGFAYACRRSDILKGSSRIRSKRVYPIPDFQQFESVPMPYKDTDLLVNLFTNQELRAP